MITYKSSSRLGALNEEDFKSDPAARGWTVTDSGSSSIGYDATYGFKITNGLSQNTNVTLENTTTKMSQYLCFYFNTPTCRYYNTPPTVTLYLNDTQVWTDEFLVGTNITNYSRLIVNVFKNNPNDYKINSLIGNYLFTADYQNISVDLNSNSVTKVKIVITASRPGSGDSNEYMYLTSLKWV